MGDPIHNHESGAGVSATHAFSPAVIVPTFNRGQSVVGVLDELKALGLGARIVVVDDGSTDDTQDRLAEWLAQHPEAAVEVRRHAVNRGKAAALHTGFGAARELGATHAATTDADGQLDSADIPRLLAIAQEHPHALILGERPLYMPGCPPRCAAGRRWTALAVRAQCGVRITDSQCGLRVYPLELIRSVRCFANRFSFETEIITRAAWAGFEVIAEPIRCQYFDQGKEAGAKQQVSHYRPWLDTLRQAVVHARLLFRAALPWPHRKRIHRRGAESARRRHHFGFWILDSGLAPRVDIDPVALVDSVNPKSKIQNPKSDRCPSAQKGNRHRRFWSRFLQWINPARCWREARAAELGRLELAIALALGVWIGTSPFFGLHALICLYFAWRLHLHPAAMVLGSQVSIPPLGALLAVASTSIGHFLMTGRGLPVGHNMIMPAWNTWPSLAGHWLSAWLLGSLLLGFALAAGAFTLTMMLGSWRSSSSRIAEADNAAASRFIQH